MWPRGFAFVCICIINFVRDRVLYLISVSPPIQQDRLKLALASFDKPWKFTARFYMHTFLCTPPVFYWKCYERTNHYAIKTLLNLGNSATYDFCLAMADMDKLEQRRTLQSLILFFRCFKLDGPNYISQFFTPRLTKYNLRDSGLNVVQPPYNSLVMHNSFQYTWLPTYGINYQLPPNPRAL